MDKGFKMNERDHWIEVGIGIFLSITFTLLLINCIAYFFGNINLIEAIFITLIPTIAVLVFGIIVGILTVSDKLSKLIYKFIKKFKT